MSEYYWCDGELDWLIYCSHKLTVAFAGDWLVEEIKTEFVDYIENEIKYIKTH